MEYMNEKKSEKPQSAGVTRVQLPICDKVVMTEVAKDYSLPDYQPEIKRLLRVSAVAQPLTRYVGGGSMEFSGAVDFCILYAGNDGQMVCFPTTAEYSFRLPLEAGADFDLNDDLVCYAVCEADTIISRVSGPRKLSIKCRLRSHVRAYGSCVMEERREGKDADGEERLIREVKTAVTGYGVSEPQIVSDEILLERENGNPVDWRVISGDAQVMVSECSCGSGKVNCRGDVILRILAQKEHNEEGALPVTFSRKVPFATEIPMDSAAVNGEAFAFGNCTQLDIGMEEDKIICDAEIVLQTVAQKDEHISVTEDWYAVGCVSECDWVTHDFPVAIRCLNGNFTQSESKTLADVGIGTMAHIVDICGTATSDSLTVENGRYVLSGKCKYSLILSSDGELSAKEVELPFRYIPDGNVGTEGVQTETQLNVVNARARMDGERLAIDSEIAVAMRLWREEPVSMVSAIRTGEPDGTVAGELIFCYPEKEETLWEIAKRYHTSLDEVMKINKLSSERRVDDATMLSGVKVLEML